MVQPLVLTSLPNDVLLTILEDPVLSPRTLYTLAFVCRTLHVLALSVYLSRKGLAPGASSVVIEMDYNTEPDLLAGLTIALFPLQLDAITCVFPGTRSIFGLTPHLERLQRFFSNIDAVDAVTLVPGVPGSFSQSSGTDDELCAWVAHFEGLLNCLAIRGCKSLTVLHGKQFTKVYTLLQDSETHEFQRVDDEPKRMRIEMGMPPAVPLSSKLSTLCIRSGILLVPPGLRWTLRALRRCPVTSLTLDFSFDAIELFLWKTVIPPLASAAAHQLTSLTVLDVPFLGDVDVLNLISRLPLLVELNIVARFIREITSKVYDGALIQLSHLETLCAPPNYIQYLLRHPASKIFPKISNICVSWPIERRNNADTALQLDRRIALNPTLLSRTLTSIIQPLSKDGLTPRLGVALDTDTWAFSSYTSQHVSPNRLSHTETMSCVTALKITTSSQDLAHVEELAAWVQYFPCVRLVEMGISSVWSDAVVQQVATVVRSNLVGAGDHLQEVAIHRI